MPRLLARRRFAHDAHAGHDLVARRVLEVGGLDGLKVGLHDGLLLHERALLVLGILVFGVLREVAVALRELDALDVRGHLLVDEFQVVELALRETPEGRPPRVFPLLLDLDEVLLQRRDDLRHAHDRRVVRRGLPRDGRLEALEEEDLVGRREPPKHLLQPRAVGEEAADEVLHAQRLAALAPLAEGDGVAQERDERGQLRPVLELLVFADDQGGQRRRGLGAAHHVREGLAAVGQGAELRDDLRDGREAQVVDGLVELGARVLVHGEERDHLADLAGGEVGGRLDEAAALPQVAAHVGGLRAREAEARHEAGEAGEEGVVNLPRRRDGERETLADLRLRVLVGRLHLALRDVFAHGREDVLRVGEAAERREPHVAVVLGGGLELNRLRLLDGDRDAGVLLESGAGLIPELLPVDGLDEAVLDAVVLQADERHRRAVRADDRLQELARLVLEQGLEVGGGGLAQDEDVILRRDDEHVAGGGVGELVALARAEVDGDALVERVDLPHGAEAPGRVEDLRARRAGDVRGEGDEFFEVDERDVERVAVKREAVQKRKKKAIVRRLLQGVPDAGGLQPLGQFLRVRPHEFERPVEVFALRARVQLAH